MALNVDLTSALQISSFKIQIQALLILNITMKGVYSLQEKFKKLFRWDLKKKTATKKPNSCKN